MSRTFLIAVGVVCLGLSAKAQAQAVNVGTIPGLGTQAATTAAGAWATTTGVVTNAGVVDAATSATPWSVGSSVPSGVIVGSPILEGGAPGAQVGPIHPYSYYVDFPNPARTYVPYNGMDVFSFQGQAYGHAYDRWTWSAMSNASPGVGRYYQILH